MMLAASIPNQFWYSTACSQGVTTVPFRGVHWKRKRRFHTDRFMASVAIEGRCFSDVNTHGLESNGPHLASEIFKCIFSEEPFILIQIPKYLVLMSPNGYELWLI